jgi:hypothetical protein
LEDQRAGSSASGTVRSMCSAPSDQDVRPPPRNCCIHCCLKQKIDQRSKISPDLPAGDDGGDRPWRSPDPLPTPPAAMAHILRSVLYPPEGHPHHLQPPPRYAASTSSAHAPTRRRYPDLAIGSDGERPQHGSFRNSPVFFHQNHEHNDPPDSVQISSAPSPPT